MAQLALRTEILKFGLVRKLVHVFQCRLHVQLVLQAPRDGNFHCLAVARMAATAIGPEAWPQPLTWCTLLQQ
jgi:hypothetical protein